MIAAAGVPDPHANAKFVLDVMDNVVKVAAVLIGGAWTYINYKRGRTYKRKLELGLSGKLFVKRGSLYFAFACRLKNVGLSEYPIEQRGTACQVSEYRGRKPELLRTFPVFEKHGWIEPGEQIEEPFLMRLDLDPGELIGLRLDLRLVSEGIEWNSSCIVENADPPSADQGVTPAVKA